MKTHCHLKLCATLSALIGLGLCAFFIWIKPAFAQCDDPPPPSNCYQCHEQEYPVFEEGEWHDIHARKDACWQCHGGNTSATTAEQAHQGVIANPLMDIQMDCYPCHPSDYQGRAQRFGALLGISIEDQSSPPPAIHSSSDSSGSPLVILPKTQAHVSIHPIVWIGPIFAGLLFLLLLLMARRIQNREMILELGFQI
jgi:hypothetical protein